MIDAKELRIGNWVNWNFYKDGRIGVVTGIIDYPKKKFINVVNDGIKNSFSAELTVEEIDPIPLTEEILEAIPGFTKDNDTHWGGWLYKISEEGECIRIVNNENGYNWPMLGHSCAKTPYLHTLQNLIFSLTGKEIEYKPEK